MHGLMTNTELLAEACRLANRQVAAAVLEPTASTPCPGWDAGLLVAHMVATLEANTALISQTPHEIDPFHPRPIEPAALAARYRSATGALLRAAAKPDAATRLIDHPAVPRQISVDDALMFPTFDAYLHSWDLSHATGLVGEYPAELTERVGDWCREVFATERPPHIVAEPKDVPEGALPIERLAAFCGRTIPTLEGM